MTRFSIFTQIKSIKKKRKTVNQEVINIAGIIELKNIV